MKNKFSKIILLLGDLISFTLPFFLVFAYLDDFMGKNYYLESNIFEYFYIHSAVGIVCIIWFLIRLRHYTYRKTFWFELKEILRTLTIFFIIELAITALSKLYISRTLWLISWAGIFILFPITRIVLKKTLIKYNWYNKNTVIIGNGKNAEEVIQALSSEKYLGFNIRYVVSSENFTFKNDNIKFIYLDNKDLLNSIPLDKNDTQFIVALAEDNRELDYWLRYLSKYGCRYVSVIPDIRGIPLYATDMSFLFSHEMILLRINNNLAKLSSRLLKRTVDILGSLTIILLLLPLLLYLYYAVKKDGGNAIYGHTRVGRNGKLFQCLKFRSMVVNSKEVLDELLATNLEAREEWEKDFKLKNDPRVTKIGKFIRRTSLDELPQLFNVLRGEMSLVGPRPIVKDELERYEENVDYYLMAKPGMTGLWQVSGRNDVDYDTRVYFDTWYVKNWSLWNDLAILCKTINVILHRNGAY